MERLDNRDVRNRIFKLAIPAIMEMTLHTLVWTADMAMVGRLNPASISAVNLGAQIMFTISNIFGALGIGATAMVSRQIGAEDRVEAENIAAQAIGIAFIASIIIGLTGILSANTTFNLIVDDPEVISLGSNYLRIVFIGAFFLIPQFVANSILRGAGNTVIPLVSAAFANAFNIIGDYVLIFGKFGFPELGVNGAAIATGTSQIIGASITFFFLIRGKSGIKLHINKVFKLNRDIIKSIVNLSVPATLETFMNEGSRLLSSFWIAQLGTAAFAAHSLANAAESISFMPGYGFAVAATTMVGQSLGAKNIERAEISTKKSVIYSVLLMTTVASVFLFVPFEIMRLFSNNLETVELASRCLRVGAVEQIPIAIAMSVSGALKGAGDTKGPFKISLVTNLAVRLPLIFIIVFVLKWNIVFVWWATAIQFIVEAVLMTIRYRRGRWKSIKI
ncbi:MATE family efflux transporter [Proteiniborus sp. MB09-C3]|uniref:MATE family efflux transporter n=1 Tax=Proteiniborus sp. MB09-C3 TaxID=3050072 RepID=UPI00255609FF|nr:MATE family efflux transporter [Proteiniborus sp. MB09-C3]WIV11862.1 MATE family efflux transporter [Proteiniborus sp. MB09-C3]